MDFNFHLMKKLSYKYDHPITVLYRPSFVNQVLTINYPSIPSSHHPSPLDIPFDHNNNIGRQVVTIIIIYWVNNKYRPLGDSLSIIIHYAFLKGSLSIKSFKNPEVYPFQGCSLRDKSESQTISA